MDALLDELVAIANNKAWTPYKRDWLDLQKISTKEKSGLPLSQWRSEEAVEDVLETFDAHQVPVPTGKLHFNPVFGSGGNAGRRVFSDGWKSAVEALAATASRGSSRARKDSTVDKRAELRAWLLGEPQSWLLSGLNAASWFSQANKLYNSGQDAFREEGLSPWAMVLACEGLPFFAGAPSRRLGARASRAAAFPFVTFASAPTSAGEAGRDNAEVWAPLWERPMSLPEVRALFARGRAEVRGRGAVTPAAFAAAIVGRGVDAGITGFARFALGRTTSTNTFEPRFEGRVNLLKADGSGSGKYATAPLAIALERVLDLLDGLPRDQKQGSNWRYVGLRGPIERTMVQLAAAPSDASVACALLDAVVAALDKVDRNRSFREKGVSWQPLPLEWLPSLFGDVGPPLEARLALAMVSSFPRSRPFAVYRFGAEWKNGRFRHPTEQPHRWVWGPGELPRVLASVLHRRTLDWDEDPRSADGVTDEPVRLVFPASLEDVTCWLDGVVDERLVERWLSRFAVFDWRYVSRAVRQSMMRALAAQADVPLSGPLCLLGLFQPLLDLQPLRLFGSPQDLLSPETGARAPAAARKLVALIRSGEIARAVDFAVGRYAMAGTFLIKSAVPWSAKSPDRLLSALLFPVSLQDRASLIKKWLRPQRVNEGGVAYV